MKLSDIKIEELYDPEDHRYWRFHWYEELALNPETRQPQVEVRFVPLIEKNWDIKANPRALLANGSYDFAETNKINISVGLLPWLHIGWIFQYGTPVACPSYQRKTFDLTITDRTTEILPIISGPPMGTDVSKVYDVPFAEYQLYGSNSFVRCLHIQVPSGRPDNISKVIIPAVELIRFHYSNSSELIQQVVTDGLAGTPNRVFDPARTIKPGPQKIPFAMLSPYVTKDDAPIVALLAFSRYAFTRAKQIYLTAQRNGTKPVRTRSGRPQGFLPEVHLPYKDCSTRLVVHGKEIRSGSERFFLVYYISSDSMTFPFEFFKFSQVGSSAVFSGEDVENPDSGPDGGGRVATVQDSPTTVITSAKDPGRNRKRVVRLGWGRKFPDLRTKDWEEQIDKARPAEPLPTFVKGDAGIKRFTPGVHEEPNNKETRVTIRCGIEKGKLSEREGEPTSTSEDDEEEKLPPRIERFESLVRTLNVAFPQKMRCELLPPAESGNIEAVAPPFYSYFPKIWENKWVHWSTVLSNGKMRTRRVAIARGVCHEKQYFYLLEIEPLKTDTRADAPTYTMLLAHGRGFGAIGHFNLRELLYRCAKNAGSWLNSKPKKGCKENEDGYPANTETEWCKFRHASTSESVFVGRILKYLERAGLLRLNSVEKADMLAIRDGRKLVVVPNDTLQVKPLMEIHPDPSKSNQLIKTVPEIDRIRMSRGTSIQQDFDFGFPKT